LSQINQGSFTPSSEAMAEKTLLEFSAPNIHNIRIGPSIDHEFKLKPSLVNLVQGDRFSGKVHEDASAHLQNFFGERRHHLHQGHSQGNDPTPLIPIFTKGKGDNGSTPMKSTHGRNVLQPSYQRISP
jgi:hypothetical protein